MRKESASVYRAMTLGQSRGNQYSLEASEGGVALDGLKQLGDPLGSVGAFSVLYATERVVCQADRCKKSANAHWAATQMVRQKGRSYLSSFSTELRLIQAAMMMQEAAVRPLLDKLIASTGLVPMSLSIGSGWPSMLWAQETTSSQHTTGPRRSFIRND